MQQAQIEAAPLPGINTIGTDAIGAALRGGLRDFRRAPQYGLFFSLIYVLGGWIIWSVYAASGQEWWLIPVIVGFPLLAPFAAIGLYEVSRRLEAGQPLCYLWHHAPEPGVAMPTVVALRPVSNAARVGEHSAVVWNCESRTPRSAIRLIAGMSTRPPAISARRPGMYDAKTSRRSGSSFANERDAVM